MVANAETMQLLACPFNRKSNSQSLVRFISKSSQRNNIVVAIGVDGRNNYIFGTYLNSTVIRDAFKAKVGSKDSTIAGNTICENFQLIIKDKNADIAVRANDPFFSWFWNASNKFNSYESQLASYVALAKNYPNSRFLISNLADNLNLYRSKDDVQKVYVNLSAKYKKTIWGEKIESFLYRTKFPNKELLTLKDSYEKIVQDGSKYNLIVFTASWCGPCIKEIPLLKKIYSDLGEELIVTYISIDTKSKVQSFEELIAINHIPWRTLFAYDNLEVNKRTYFVETIPHSILVYPNQSYHIIDVRKEAERSKLYSLVRSIENRK